MSTLAEYEMQKEQAEAFAADSIGWMLRSKSTGAAWIEEGCIWFDWDDACHQANLLNRRGDNSEEPRDWEPRPIQFKELPPRQYESLEEFLKQRAEYLEKAKYVYEGSY